MPGTNNQGNIPAGCLAGCHHGIQSIAGQIDDDLR